MLQIVINQVFIFLIKLFSSLIGSPQKKDIPWDHGMIEKEKWETSDRARRIEIHIKERNV